MKTSYIVYIEAKQRRVNFGNDIVTTTSSANPSSMAKDLDYFRRLVEEETILRLRYEKSVEPPITWMVEKKDRLYPEPDLL